LISASISGSGSIGSGMIWHLTRRPWMLPNGDVASA
jgi:hypothetical protein